jgi:hypothetical protein
MIIEKKRVNKKAREEARNFINDGSLRQIMEMHGHLSHEAIDKIVDAASWALKV